MTALIVVTVLIGLLLAGVGVLAHFADRLPQNVLDMLNRSFWNDTEVEKWTH
jgi:hypothetical protein